MTVLKAISSMATQQVLAALASQYRDHSGVDVQVESVGGVDAAKRVAAGESFDLVLLASDAVDKLIASGHLLEGSRMDWVQSPVAIATPAQAPVLDISNEDAVKAAVLAAPSISYSTGPSGNYLNQLFAKWGIADQIKHRLVVPPPGTSVGSLLAKGEVALGFQQLSELKFVEGVSVLGNLPQAIAFVTTFSSGIPTAMETSKVQAAQGFQVFLASKTTAGVKVTQGMYW